MPASIAILLLVAVVVFLAVAPHLRRRHAELEATPDRARLGLDGPALSPIVSATPGTPLPPIPEQCYPPHARPLPHSFEALPGHRRHRHLAAVIPPRESPYDHEIEGL